MRVRSGLGPGTGKTPGTQRVLNKHAHRKELITKSGVHCPGTVQLSHGIAHRPRPSNCKPLLAKLGRD